VTGSQALVAHGAGDVSVEPRPAAALEPGQVRLAVAYGGICGSDLSYYRYGAVGDFRVREPLVLGHEVSGVVAELGPDAGERALPVGARVTVHPATVDGTCPMCLSGHPNRCVRARYLGSAASMPHTQGGFRESLVVRADQLVALPAALGLRRATLAEPLGVALHGLRRGVAGLVASGAAVPVPPYDPAWWAGGSALAGLEVCVVGAGPIGALCVAAARAAGANVSATDLSAHALSVATALGAARTLDVTGLAPADIAARLHADGPPPDVVVESSGSAPGLVAALHLARRGGTVVMLGLPPAGDHGVPASLVPTRELTLLGAFRFDDEIALAVELLAAGLRVDAVLTHELPLADAVAALDLAADASVSSKVLLRMPGAQTD